MNGRRWKTAMVGGLVLLWATGCIGPVHVHLFERHTHKAHAETGDANKAQSYIDSLLIGDEDVFETVEQ